MIELFEKIVSRKKSLNIYEKKSYLMFVWVLNTALIIQLSRKEKAAFHGLDVSLLRNMVKENIKKTLWNIVDFMQKSIQNPV